jgi:hypothetical protein
VRVRIVLGFKYFDLGVVSKLSQATCNHLVEAGRLRSDLFVSRGGQFREALVAAMGDTLRVEQVICLLVDFSTAGIDSVNDGLLGP